MFILILLSVASVLSAVGLQFLTGWYETPVYWWYLLLTITGFWLVYSCVLALIMIVGSLFLKPGLKKENRPRKGIYNYCRYMIDFAVKLARIRVTRSGFEKLPKNQRYLFVANHRSNWDPALAIVYLNSRPMVCMTKPGNLSIPIGGAYIHGFGCLQIDKNDDRAAARALKKASNYIRDDQASILIHPEGRRSKNAKLCPFQAGSFKIATKVQAPIVVGCFCKTETIAKKFPFGSAHVYFDIIKVIPYEEYKDLSTQEIADMVRAMIAEQIVKREGHVEYDETVLKDVK